MRPARRSGVARRAADVERRAADVARRGRAAQRGSLARRAAVFVTIALACIALAQDGADASAKRLTIERESATIVITQVAESVTGSRFILRNPNCAEETFSSIFYAPPPGTNQTVIDGDTVLTSRLVVVREPREEGGADRQTLELRDADVEFNRPGCVESSQPIETPQVTLEQGRTTIIGSRFFLDQGTDLGTMDGPVEVERAADGDSPALSATSEALELDIDTEVTTLVGGVEIRSENRVSEADRMELREAEGVAILTGTPARTRQGEDVVEGSTLLYYLDTNDVIVLGSVKGTIDLPE